MKGKVTLIGAGAGDISLMTIKGYERLKNAECVVYDRLVSEDILKIIPDGAEKINAGKKSSEHLIAQEEINKILLEKALEGKNVVRLKGGDSFLFARGGEELELLWENGIEFEVIPGVTSALAVPAYGGIPVTHRDFSSSVHIMTGHRKKNEPLSIDFDACVKIKGTFVFLMCLANIGEIAEGLIKAGMDKDTKCCVIENGCRTMQRKIIGKLWEIEEKCKREDIKSPAAAIIGEVCSLSEKFDWYERLPLKGKRIIATRPKERIGKLAGKLREMGAEVIEMPCIRTEGIIADKSFEEIRRKIKEYKWVVFTSPSGVRILFEKMKEKKADGRIFGGNKIGVIGKGTGEELERYGLTADLMPKEYDGKNLGKKIAEKAKGEKVLLLRAKNGSRELTEELERAGIEYEDFPIYKTIYCEGIGRKEREMTKRGEIDFVIFTSSSTVRGFCENIKDGYDKFTAVSIGKRTSRTAEEYGIKNIIESDEATVEGIIERIVKETLIN